jgi:hypothetical protein
MKDAQLIVLSFLLTNVYATVEVIQELLQQKSVQAAYQILNRMVANKLLRKAAISFLGKRSITLFGITNHGIAIASANLGIYKDCRTFQPSKVSISTLQHKIDIQRIQIMATRLGFDAWKDGSELGFREKTRKVPDAIATFKGQAVAFEIEREAKSIRRYKDILLSHLVSRKEGRWDHIVYFCPTASLAEYLQKKLRTINKLTLNGRLVYLNDEHFSHFSFYTYNDFPLFFLELGEKNLKNSNFSQKN